MDAHTEKGVMDLDDQRKINFLRTIFSVGTIVLAFFATKALIDGRIFLSIIEYIVAVSFLLSLFYVHFTNKTIFTSHYLVIVLGLLFLLLTVKEGINHSCWGFVLPPFAMFLLGTRKGILFIAAYFFLLVVFSLDWINLPHATYSSAYKLRYAGAFFAITVISFFYENTRSIFYNRMMSLLRELSGKNKLLLEISKRDSLTGLLNHKALHERLIVAFEEASRHQHPLSLIMMDIDKFKSINDCWGHQAGDEVIKKVSAVLKETLRGYDVSMRFVKNGSEAGRSVEVDLTAARYGGDEFVLILPHCGEEGILGVAERILTHIRSVRIEAYPDIRITASIGIGLFNGVDNGIRYTQLVNMADQALYKVKEQGRNNICLNTYNYE